MRILFLTQWFEPEPVMKGLSLAKSLAAQGHEVRVLTGFPNYPGGNVYPGYKIKLIQREVMEGIPVTRVPLYPSHSRSKIGRILNYAGFGVTSMFYGLFSRWRPDVMYVFHPPLTTGLAGAIIGMIRRVPFVLDVQDLWPDTLKATGMMSNDRVLAIVGRLMRWTYRRATLILPQSEGFRKRMLEAGVPSSKLRVIRNWCHEDALSNRPKKDWQPPPQFYGKFVAGFAGNIGAAQACDSLLDAAAILQKTHDNIVLFLVGGGMEVERLKEKAAAMELRNLLMIPAMPMQEVGVLLERADALIVHLRRDPLFAITMPAKIQAYMFLGKPIVMAVEGDAAALLDEAGCGINATPEDPAAIAAAIAELAALPPEVREAMGKRGQDYYMRELSVSAATQTIISALNDAIRMKKKRR